MDCEKMDLCQIAETKFSDIEEKWDIRLIAMEKSSEKADQLLSLRLDMLEKESRAYITRRETALINLIVGILLIAASVFVAHMLK